MSAASSWRRRAAIVMLAACALASWAPLGAATGEEPLTPAEHRRGTEQTYLTFPEWFLVFSPAEYAAFVQHHPPSEFPFAGHVRQYWQSYGFVDRAAAEYPRNSEYHIMIWTIGVSTAVEYGARLAYETLFGRVSELTTTYGETAEDRLHARVAQDYVDFIRVRPFYEFDYVTPLIETWKAPWLGHDMLRKWERKYALSTEYGAKAAYAWVMKKLTQASYGVSGSTTAAVIDRLPEGVLSELPEAKVLAQHADGSVLLLLPRYAAFQHQAEVLAARGARFVEIAGNRTVLLVTALVPRDQPPVPEGARVLFSQPILTDPTHQRVAYVVPVASLHTVLPALSRAPAQVEHVFDY